MTGTLSGTTVLITGGNAGIGYSTAKGLALQGAKIILGCRNVQRAQEAVNNLKAETRNDDISFKLVDISLVKSVQEFGEEILATETRLDVLILNAGVLGSTRWEQTEEKNEVTFASNHLGHFHLTNMLLPLLEKSAPSRIVIVSSTAYQIAGITAVDDVQVMNGYGQVKAYAQSKLFNILHCKELAKRTEGKGITANCLHPGVVATGFLKNQWYGRFVNWFTKTPDTGARTSIYLATSQEVKDISGLYFSDCLVTDVNAVASNMVIAAKLWQISEELVKKALEPQPSTSGIQNIPVEAGVEAKSDEAEIKKGETEDKSHETETKSEEPDDKSEEAEDKSEEAEDKRE